MKLSELAAKIGARVVGDGNLEIGGVAGVANADHDDIVFAEDEENFAGALKSQASAVIAGSFAENAHAAKALLIAANPRLAFARAAGVLRVETSSIGIHPSAVIDAKAKLGNGVSVGANAVIGRSIIGERTSIGAGCVIGDGVEIGKGCEIYPHVTIYPGSRLGNRVIVHAGAVLGSDGFGYVRDSKSGQHEKFPQIGKLEIGDDVEIGANTTIDRGALETTRIGRGTKIDNLVHIGHNCQFGEDVIIAAQAGFSGSITIENNVVIGGQVGVGEHARIQEGVLLGGQAGVLPKKILRGKGIAFWGTPAKPLREYLRSLASLARLGKRE
ncbi:MAG TPA: UDP-3-O-(3-hydroxymyristoyl)glucosamine N-acyltransferase [Terriglobales bacterium]|jgi:UDP-3-O-[3-hydroxymyristoyl] glucosamine N-acyltransferase|nr:UDP-3-O-(3-hydroxymyristoyl)glucosamine N-acyltransferase [Terriglobales bacterium]